MDKAVYSGTILICAVLVIGSGWFPDNAGMWLASTSVLMNVVRVVIGALMLGLLFTDPPRRLAFRALLGVSSLAFLTAAVERALSGSIQIVDALIFLEVAVGFGLAAMEGQPIPMPAAVPERPRQPYFTLGSQLSGMPLHRKFSDVSGVIRLRRGPAELVGQTAMLLGFITKAVQPNLRPPYRVLWRGS